MAAIIAQLSRANWERKKNKRRTVPPDKSVSILPAFDARFDPLVHNPYLRCKTVAEEKKRREKLRFVDEVLWYRNTVYGPNLVFTFQFGFFWRKGVFATINASKITICGFLSLVVVPFYS